MWSTLLGISSFVVLPITLFFLILATGHAIFTLEWKFLLIAGIVFAVALAVHVVFGIIVQG